MTLEPAAPPPPPPPPPVREVPVDLVDVANPRVRSRRSFRDLKDSIAAVGLKRPITVAERRGPGGVRYDLVCGQGRLEAFRELGQRAIPAVVVDAGAEDCLVMSLVENVARRQHHALDLLRDIGGMAERGHAPADIARKTGLSPEHVRGLLRLLARGETRLLRAVEAGAVPVSVALGIAEAGDADAQRVLQEAYERNLLRGHGLQAARRLVEQRQRRGRRAPRDPGGGGRRRPLSVAGLMKSFEQDVARKRLLVRDAAATRDRLLFVVEALRALVADEGFVNLLRAEGLATLPAPLAERIGAAAEAARP